MVVMHAAIILCSAKFFSCHFLDNGCWEVRHLLDVKFYTLRPKTVDLGWWWFYLFRLELAVLATVGITDHRFDRYKIALYLTVYDIALHIRQQSLYLVPLNNFASYRVDNLTC